MKIFAKLISRIHPRTPQAKFTKKIINDQKKITKLLINLSQTAYSDGLAIPNCRKQDCDHPCLIWSSNQLKDAHLCLAKVLYSSMQPYIAMYGYITQVIAMYSQIKLPIAINNYVYFYIAIHSYRQLYIAIYSFIYSYIFSYIQL